MSNRMREKYFRNVCICSCEAAPKSKKRKRNDFQSRIWTTSRAIFGIIQTDSECPWVVVWCSEIKIQKSVHSKKFVFFPPTLKPRPAEMTASWADLKCALYSQLLVLNDDIIKIQFDLGRKISISVLTRDPPFLSLLSQGWGKWQYFLD